MARGTYVLYRFLASSSSWKFETEQDQKDGVVAAAQGTRAHKVCHEVAKILVCLLKFYCAPIKAGDGRVVAPPPTACALETVNIYGRFRVG